MTQPPGVHLSGTRAHFRVHSGAASAVWLCLFDGERESRVAMTRSGDQWCLDVSGIKPGQRYGYRAEGEWAPDRGLWFDAAKLLTDPYAVELDRRYAYDPRLSVYGADTAGLVPKGKVAAASSASPLRPALFEAGGLIYEINVRGFTMLHPDIPQAMRGTVAALAHPAIIAHLKALHVSAVELMPITAWIDERHLHALGLRNAWGYNPVGLMALDPGLVPGGLSELRDTVSALHREGIGVILDLVFNHTGESDAEGPTLSMRGLDAHTFYAHDASGRLINDSGCGNTLNTAHPVVRTLILDTLRHFVREAGVDGFRFDLAPILAREPHFNPQSALFDGIARDPLLSTRIMIAEPWDIGPGGYQLGHFPPSWLEWNDRYRDDVRRFWLRSGRVGDLATRLAGSSDIFGPQTRSVNFICAHDGFTLADLVSYNQRHNQANGEQNRDGHGENFSFNHGAEGPTRDQYVLMQRGQSQRALLATLFASSGSIMLTAGDEFGRSQAGNNNAYAQDNESTWVNWSERDTALEAFVCALSARRAVHLKRFAQFPENALWSALDGGPMQTHHWEDPATHGFDLHTEDHHGVHRLRIDRLHKQVAIGEGD
jgi:glycogen debranching enzyme